jgi:outer membrane protein OmpA-like peptidoglycan-associated protein
MKTRSNPTIAGAVALAIATCLAMAPGSAAAQTVRQDAAIISSEVSNQVDAYMYKADSTSRMQFKGTGISPASTGDAKVKTEKTSAEVDSEFEKLAPPASLGPYTVYVLWGITPEGRANNLGTLELRDSGHAKLDVTTPMTAFAMIVTAEPHSLVTIPSTRVVLTNYAKEFSGSKQPVTTLVQRADYSTLTAQSPQKKRPIEVDQARYAVAIAAAANAEELAGPAYATARTALASAEGAWASKKYSERKRAPDLARTAIQAGEDARVAALRRGEELKKAEAEQAAMNATVQAQAATAVALAEQGRARSAENRAKNAELSEEETRAALLKRMNEALPTRDTPRGLVAEISDVNFAVGKSELNRTAGESLARLAGVLATYKGLDLTIEGHTDSTGSEATNMTLSNGRALAVRDFLVKQGVPASQIDVQGKGSTMPVADNSTAGGRAQNRRVEIIVSGAGISPASASR